MNHGLGRLPGPSFTSRSIPFFSQAPPSAVGSILTANINVATAWSAAQQIWPSGTFAVPVLATPISPVNSLSQTISRLRFMLGPPGGEQVFQEMSKSPSDWQGLPLYIPAGERLSVVTKANFSAGGAVSFLVVEANPAVKGFYNRRLWWGDAGITDVSLPTEYRTSTSASSPTWGPWTILLPAGTTTTSSVFLNPFHYWIGQSNFEAQWGIGAPGQEQILPTFGGNLWTGFGGALADSFSQVLALALAGYVNPNQVVIPPGAAVSFRSRNSIGSVTGYVVNPVMIESVP